MRNKPLISALIDTYNHEQFIEQAVASGRAGFPGGQFRFFRFANLYSVDALIGGYRNHTDALSWSAIEECHRNCEKIVEN